MSGEKFENPKFTLLYNVDDFPITPDIHRNYNTVGLVLRRGYVLQYLVVNEIVLKRVLFKWFIFR